MAGFVGSRMSSNVVEKGILIEALPQSAAAAGSPAVAAAIKEAKTVADQAAIATGVPVPNVKPPKEIDLVRQATDVQNELLSLFDVPTLKGVLHQAWQAACTRWSGFKPGRTAEGSETQAGSQPRDSGGSQ